jgi:hypothetical protein
MLPAKTLIRLETTVNDDDDDDDDCDADLFYESWLID